VSLSIRKSSSKKLKVPVSKPIKKPGSTSKLTKGSATRALPNKKQTGNKIKSASSLNASSISKVSKTPQSHNISQSPLPKELALKIFDQMLISRALEERLIKIYKAGHAYFWIGGPGEEAFGVSLGHLINKGQGLDHDYLHLHYRCTPTLVALGLEPVDAIRLTMNRATDRSTGGRNFSGHYCYPEWNVVPVSSPIEVQYTMALGTARAQMRAKSKGITIVTGGDAGTAEGDFASCLVWSSRPGSELPIYITVQNNYWGISTDYKSQHGEASIADRGKAFGIRTSVINGNDPFEVHAKMKEDIDYIKKTGRPVLSEIFVSRLYGHSSASGANFVDSETCCIAEYSKKLSRLGWIEKEEHLERLASLDNEYRILFEKVCDEPGPSADTIWDHTYANNENGDWRKF